MNLIKDINERIKYKQRKAWVNTKSEKAKRIEKHKSK